VEDTTPPGKQRILLRTADEALEGRATVELTIFYLPRDFEVVGTRVQTDVHGVAYYQQIRRRLNDRESVECIVIPQEKKTRQASPRDPPTFYIGSNKVTRGQF